MNLYVWYYYSGVLFHIFIINPVYLYVTHWSLVLVELINILNDRRTLYNMYLYTFITDNIKIILFG